MSSDIPTSLDDLVRDTRARVERMRRQLGNPEDFDYLIRQQTLTFLADYDRRTVAFTMRAIFGATFGTGWLYEPDTDGEGTLPFWPDPQHYRRAVATFARAGFQCATHATGDRGVREALDAYREAGSMPLHGRHRIGVPCFAPARRDVSPGPSAAA